jgi:TetR/AcrR family transcriptional repressor of mexJK operon
MRTRTDAKRLEILAAARAEFGTRGFHETRLADVAQRMGSSKATIYNYFPSKGALLGATLAAAAIPLTAALRANFEAALPFPEKLTRFARGYVAMLTGETPIALQRLLIAESGKSRAIARPLYERPDLHAWPHLALLFREEQKGGMLIDGDTSEMARHLCNLLHGDLPLRLLFGESDVLTDAEKDASADSAVRMFLAAYAVG